MNTHNRDNQNCNNQPNKLAKISHYLPMLLLIGAVSMVYCQLNTDDLNNILSSLQDTSLRAIVTALAFTAINYLLLAGYDWLALRFTGHQHIPLSKILPTAVLSYAISNNTGHAWAAGGSIRYRFYTQFAIPGWDILKISLFETMTYLIGAVSLGLIGSLLFPYYVPSGVAIPSAIHWVSVICATILIGYWCAIGLWRKPLKLNAFEMYLPTLRMTLAQTLLASVDILLSALVLWVLLADNINLDFGAFLAIFVLAQVLGFVSQVPGGIGVFESVLLWLMADIQATDQHLIVLGALLLYRVIYYFIPLLLAGLGLLVYEIDTRRQPIKPKDTSASLTLHHLVVLGSTMLLATHEAFSASIATLNWIPAPSVEFSPWIGSFIGMLLLFTRNLWLKLIHPYRNRIATFNPALRFLQAPVLPVLIKPSADEINMAINIVTHAGDTRGYLTLLGDKYLAWSEDHSAFIMFGVTRDYWIAMGDPIGDQQAFGALLKSFRQQAHEHRSKVVFYQASEAFLPFYLDLGLSFYKLGEEAKVDLSRFTLQGRSRSSQRGIRNHLTKAGFSFEVLPAEAVAPLLPTLRDISDRWLISKHTCEKGFSLGYFDEAYLCRTDLAVVRDQSGQIVAFANLLQTQHKQELSVDLTRYIPDIPGGIMEFLYVELILWGQQQQYQYFLMGMAPLAGLQNHRLAPRWHKIGTLLFNKGERFYNFKGVYHYKEKFDPVWESRYLAAPNDYSVPFILLMVTRLISGSWKGIFLR